MTSHTELLAELEEKRLENKEIPVDPNEISIVGSEGSSGYDPYNNPSLGKEMPDDVDVTARRRQILERHRRR